MRTACAAAAAALLLLQAAAVPAAPACSPGTAPGTVFNGHPDRRPPGELHGTWCGGGAVAASWAGEAFTLGRSLPLYISGYPNAQSQRLWLQRADGARLRLVVYEEPGPRWASYHFRVPEAWRGAAARLLLDDAGHGDREWLAVSGAPAVGAPGGTAAGNALPAVMAAGYLLLLLAPGLAVAVAAGRERDPLWAWCAALLCSACVAWLALWAAMLDPRLATALLAAAWLFTLAVAALRPRPLARLLAHGEVWRPAALAVAAVAFYAAAAFLYTGFDEAVKVTGWRYSHKLPGDNIAPLLLARAFAAGEVPPPPVEGWLSSDRPPLQAAVAVLHWPLFGLRRVAGIEQHYQALGMALQTLWIPALWLLLARWQVSPAGRALAFAACLASSVVIVNTAYVWPKLLAAAYLLLGAGLLLGPRRDAAPRSAAEAAAGGAALAVALLAHGGAVFGIAAIGALRLWQRPPPGWRYLAAGAAAALVLYAPWAAYQALVDPPGNRLAKWYLAGAREIDARGTFEALADAYRRPLSELLHNRVENLRALAGAPADGLAALATLASAHESGARREALARVRGGQFFRLGESLLLLLPAGLAALAADLLRRRRAPRAAGDAGAGRTLLALGLIATAVWVLLLYGPGYTLLHQGTYLIALALIAGSALQLWALSRALAAALVAAWCAVHAWLYWWLPPSALWAPALAELVIGTRLPSVPAARDAAIALAAAAALCAALVAIARAPASRP